MLFKNTLKIFLKKKFELIALGVIIAVSSFIYSAMYYAIDGLKEPTEAFFKENKQENFSIDYLDVLTRDEVVFIKDKYKIMPKSMVLSNLKLQDKDIYYNVLEKRIKKFNSRFTDYKLNVREAKDVNFKKDGKSNKIRFLKKTDDMNIPLIEDGRYPKENNEIAITKIYAEKNKIDLNNTLKVNNKNYKVVGYVLFPDYNMPILGKEFIIDNGKISIGLTTDKEFENLNGKYISYFSGLGKENFDEKDFNNNVIEKYKDYKDLDFISNIVMTKNQMRSGVIYDEIKGGKAMSLGLSLIIALIAIMITAIIIYKVLKKERGQIGLLKALGYSRKEMLMPYLFIITIMALPMLVLGYFLGIYAAEPLKNLYLEFYLLPSLPIKQKPIVFLTAVFVPLVFFVGLSMFVIMKMISKKAINLLNTGEKSGVTKANKLVSKIFKNSRAQTKFKYSFIFNNTGKFAVFFFGVLFTSFLIIMSLMFSGFFDKMTTDYYKSVNYNYEAYVDYKKPLPKIDKGMEKFITFPEGLYEDEKISALGIENDSNLHKLFNNKKEDITEKLKDGVIVNESFKSVYGVKKGDKIDIKLGDKKVKKEVVDVSSNYGDKIVYFDREKLSNLLTDKKDFFNGVYSENALDKDEYSLIINKNDILEQGKNMQAFTKIAIYSMLISAVFIAVIILYILTSLTVEDNYYNISLLKVMGYSRKEVNKMILSSYFVYSILCYLISIPMTVFSMRLAMKFLAKQFNMVIPIHFTVLQGFIGAAVVALVFYISTIAAKRKIYSISIQEVLKAYRE